jgi:hypothetical protein
MLGEKGSEIDLRHVAEAVPFAMPHVLSHCSFYMLSYSFNYLLYEDRVRFY